jgi:DNA-binding Lrp family transcriptional regulator
MHVTSSLGGLVPSEPISYHSGVTAARHRQILLVGWNYGRVHVDDSGIARPRMSNGTPRSMMASRSAISAFVLITVPANKSGDIVRILMDDYSEFVTEAAAVYGEADVIAKVETPSIEQLHRLVMDKIQNLPNVRVTRTFIIIPQLHEIK